MSDKEILLVYDKECPACDMYCQLVKIQKNYNELKIIDAREKSDVMEEISAHGFDIDEGMILKMDGKLYYGSNAIHTLAMISNRSDMFNWLNYWLFRSESISNSLYPILRFCRGLLLKFLGKTRINNLGKLGNENF